MKHVAAVLAAILIPALVLVSCGDDDGKKDREAAKQDRPSSERSMTGAGITIDPTSGPAGTKIAWTAGGRACRFGTKHVALGRGRARVPKDLQDAQQMAREHRRATVAETSGMNPKGTITVPKDAAPGEYWIDLTCNRRIGNTVSVGEVTIGFGVTPER